MSLRDDYNRNGYAVEKRGVCVYSDYWSNKLNMMRALLKRDKEAYINMCRVESSRVGMQRLFTDGRAISLLNSLGISDAVLIGTPVAHIMSPDLRIPDGYNGTEAHQDWASTQGSLDCVTVWIPFHDTKDNFPLEVIPGSHLQGLKDGKLNGSVLEIECDDKDFTPIECEAGDVVFMSGFVIHRTRKKGVFRVAVSQRFDNASEPTFIDRGYPCAQRRIVDREIRWKPTPEQIRSIYAVG